MADETITCSLTKGELKNLLEWHGCGISTNTEHHIERIKYLHKRLIASEATASEAKPAHGWGALSNG